MGILSLLSVVIVGGAVLLGGFLQYAKLEMKNYVIDYSQTPSKVIVITGANSGLGYYTALALAKEKAVVIMACRSRDRCESAKATILKEAPKATVECMDLDLASFESIRTFAKEFTSKYDHLDVLVNNAGIMALPEREVTADGLEFQIGTNHFGHFLLTALLFPHIATNGRIINHSSGAHLMAASNFVFKDLLSEKSYDPWIVYGNSKLANLFFTYELNRRLTKDNNPKNIMSIAVHPGYTSTNLQNSRFPFWEYLNEFAAMKGEEGALSQIYAAIDPNAKKSDNDYFGPIYMMFGKPVVQPTGQNAWDTLSQAKLWQESERITGTKLL